MIYLITKAQIAEWLQLPGTEAAGIDNKRINACIKEAQDFDLKQAIGYPLFFDLLNSYSSENLTVNYTNLDPTTFGGGETISGKNSNGDVVATGRVVSDADLATLVLSNITGDWDSVATLLGTTSGATADVSTVVYGKYYKLLNGDEYSDPSGYTVNYEGLIPALCYWAYSRLIRKNSITVTSHGVRTKTGGGYSDAVSEKTTAENILQLRSGAESYLTAAKKYLNDKNNGSITYLLWNVTQVSKRKGGVRFSPVDRYASENSVQSTENYPVSSYGGYAASSANLTGLPLIYTLLNTFSYVSAELLGKTIYSVQLGSDMLTPNQYTLVGSTFTIISTVDDPIVIAAGMPLRITYQT
jgi:hypothetical protein